MQLEKNGKYIIKEIKFKKNSIVLVVNDETYKISNSTYSHFYLYKDKKLSKDELNEILKYEEEAKIKDYLFKLVSSSLYSKKQIEEKLNKKKVNKKTKEKLIDELILKGYLDDKNFAYEKFEILERKNFGKNKIIKTLLNDGIDKKIIDELDFDNEENKARINLNKYILMHKNSSYNSLKKKAYDFLLTSGFSNELSLSLIEEMILKDDEEEIKTLESVLSKYILLHRINLNDDLDKQKVISYLLRKGYKYDQINEVLRRKQDEIC